MMMKKLENCRGEKLTQLITDIRAFFTRQGSPIGCFERFRYELNPVPLRAPDGHPSIAALVKGSPSEAFIEQLSSDDDLEDVYLALSLAAMQDATPVSEFST